MKEGNRLPVRNIYTFALCVIVTLIIITGLIGVVSSHTVNLISPANNSYTNLNNKLLQFVYNHTGTLTGIVNCTLYIDGNPVNYSINVPANTSWTVYSNQSWNEGTHYWYVNCTNGTDTESSLDIGQNYTFTADFTPPNITNVRNATPMATTVWILWNLTNHTWNNRVNYSTNPDLSNSSWSSWQNNTQNPKIKLWSLQPNTTYYYRVYSYNPDNSSIYSNSSIYNFTTQECVSYKLVNASDASITGIDHPIQEAIDMICYEGGTVELGEGTFNVTKTIRIMKSNIRLNGTHNSVIHRMTPELSTIEISDVYNIKIKGFNTTSELTYYPESIIDAYNVSNLVIDDIYENSFMSWSFGTNEGPYPPYNYINHNITIRNCIITGSISFRFTEYIYIYNNTIDSTGRRYCSSPVGLLDINRNDEYIKIYNNTIRYTKGNMAVRVHGGAKNAEIHNNIITGPYRDGAIFIDSMQDSVIHNNRLTGKYGIGFSAAGPIINVTIRNNIIYNTTSHGIYSHHYQDYSMTPIIKNNVIFNCGDDGVNIADYKLNMTLTNNIISKCGGYGINLLDGTADSAYNNLWNNTLGSYNNTNCTTCISVDPLFADPDNGDFHLKSHAGRWNGTTWVCDNETSPCIDAGDPNSTYSKEIYPHGQRINIGAYGNTSEASKSPYHKIYLSVPMTIYSNGEYSYPEPPITYKDNQTVNITFNVTDTTNLTINSYTSSQIGFTATNTTTDQKMNITVYNGTFKVVNGKKYEIKKDGVVQQTKTASDNKVVFTDIPVGSDYVITESGDNGYTITLSQGYNMLAWTSTTPTNSSNLCNEVPNCTYVYKKNPDGSWTAKQCGYPGGEFTVSRGFGFLAYVTEACEWTRDE